VSVHSKLLGTNDAVGTGAVTIVTSDATHRIIVKQLTVQNKHTAAIRIAFLLYNGATVLARFNLYLTAAANSAGDTLLVPCWIVLTEGYHMECAVTAGTASVSVSGTALSL
jgi:hypothetical protein